MEKTGTDLETDRKYEQDKPEVLHEGKGGRICAESEMAQKDTDEEYPCRTYGNAFDLEFGKIKAGSDYDTEKKYCVRYASTCK